MQHRYSKMKLYICYAAKSLLICTSSIDHQSLAANDFSFIFTLIFFKHHSVEL
eukprot:TRINITY_DN96_c0_g1_i3.p3 TRINITY_DN96_c0_g1~~TRINITY_DN96_c0_g1_i3.p3  ORF type:complete len:53 (+),score=3.67 TRINITY_DN96_c0_g1_i3:294-452(+)